MSTHRADTIHVRLSRSPRNTPASATTKSLSPRAIGGRPTHSLPPPWPTCTIPPPRTLKSPLRPAGLLARVHLELHHLVAKRSRPGIWRVPDRTRPSSRVRLVSDHHPAKIALVNRPLHPPRLGRRRLGLLPSRAILPPDEEGW